MLESGLNDEGLFRISPKQIKLEKMKAHIDSQHFEDLGELLADSDAHLHSALLKCYLRCKLIEIYMVVFCDIKHMHRS